MLPVASRKYGWPESSCRRCQPGGSSPEAVAVDGAAASATMQHAARARNAKAVRGGVRNAISGGWRQDAAATERSLLRCTYYIYFGDVKEIYML